MKFKPGDKITIKSKEWYESSANSLLYIVLADGQIFQQWMSQYCGQTFTVKYVTDLGYLTEEHPDIYFSPYCLE